MALLKNYLHTYCTSTVNVKKAAEMHKLQEHQISILLVTQKNVQVYSKLKSVSLLIKIMQSYPFHNLYCYLKVQHCRNIMGVNIDPLPESVRASRALAGRLLSVKRCLRGKHEFLFWTAPDCMPDLWRQGKTVRGKQCWLLLHNDILFFFSLYFNLLFFFFLH